ncbi:MAG: response regulator [Cellulosilyticum sp.]|nr:response regulator [Cellulosilyticum sp.]
MYKIMLADDEGIVLQSLQMIIEKHFGELCQIKTAKTGRSVIELAEDFMPDIALMDIQMPGINGIDAIEEIQKFSKSTYFIIISAYDKFDYAKKAIDLGVVDFLTKPFNKERIIQVLEKTMQMIDKNRRMREIDLRNKEKLETVVPIIESGMIYHILFQEDCGSQINHFKQLLDIQEEYGFILVIEFGDEQKETSMTNPIGATVKAQRFYNEMREIIKEFFKGYVGTIMANKVVVFVPCSHPEIEYNERIQIIGQAREMVHKLKGRIDSAFKVGIGSVQNMEQLLVSYKEAVKAMKMVPNTVSHIKDILPKQVKQMSQPIELEKQLFVYLKKRNLAAFLEIANHLYGVIVEHYERDEMAQKMKLLEILIAVQREVKEYVQIEMELEIEDLKELLQSGEEALKSNFINYISRLYEWRENKKEEVYSDLITSAKKIIDDHYHQDINLEMISRQVNISPYYFSKIFKEETGENFIDYVTHVRIEKAKKSLKEGQYSIKEVCINVGYKDPNYFSRLFKKQVGVTPTEYREGTGNE